MKNVFNLKNTIKKINQKNIFLRNKIGGGRRKIKREDGIEERTTWYLWLELSREGEMKITSCCTARKRRAFTRKRFGTWSFRATRWRQFSLKPRNSRRRRSRSEVRLRNYIFYFFCLFLIKKEKIYSS